MNKSELIEAIANSTGVTKTQSAAMLDAFVGTVVSSLKKKKPVTLVGFGTFDVQRRKARTGRNPATGEAIKIKAQTAPKFRPGKTLKDAVNK